MNRQYHREWLVNRCRQYLKETSVRYRKDIFSDGFQVIQKYVQGIPSAACTERLCDSSPDSIRTYVETFSGIRNLEEIRSYLRSICPEPSDAGQETFCQQFLLPKKDSYVSPLLHEGDAAAYFDRILHSGRLPEIGQEMKTLDNIQFSKLWDIFVNVLQENQRAFLKEPEPFQSNVKAAGMVSGVFRNYLVPILDGFHGGLKNHQDTDAVSRVLKLLNLYIYEDLCFYTDPDPPETGTVPSDRAYELYMPVVVYTSDPSLFGTLKGIERLPYILEFRDRNMYPRVVMGSFIIYGKQQPYTG